MHIYVASSWRNTYYPEVVQALRDAGHEVYDFRNPPTDNKENGCSLGSPQEPAERSAWGERRQELPRRFSGVVSTSVTSLPNAAGFHWTDVDPNCMDWTPAEYQANLSHPLAERQFKNDIEAMTVCDACVLVLPCGRSAHTEAGWFAGQGKKVYVLIPDKDSFEPELMYKLFTKVCVSLEELIESINNNTSVH